MDKMNRYDVNNPRVENGVTTWDLIEFGNHCQGEKSQLEPIRWRVLSVNGDDAFLLADKNLDCVPYNEKRTAVTWETCTLRKWLNNDFYNMAFDTEEKKAVIETNVVNKDNTEYGTEGGNDTKDRVYMLSKDEACNAEYGFDEEFTKESRTRISTGNGYWWLRSPGSHSNSALCVGCDGYGHDRGSSVNFSRFAVRPALHINLSSSVWRKVGEISVYNDVGNPADVDVKRDVVVSNPRVENGITTWDLIEFGKNYQGENSELEPIKWRVLSVNGDDAFLLADKNFDCVPYNEKRTDVTWETCTLRKWLNNDFYNKVFDTEEKKAVMETMVVNNGNPKYGTKGYNDTKDRVYLLSIDEVCNAEYGFEVGFNKFSKTRESKNTGYAKIKGVYSYRGVGCWWLRSPGNNSNIAAYVNNDGYGNYYGNYVDDSKKGVRPALHINLSSSVWKKVGEINSEGDVAGPEGISNPKVEKGITTWDLIEFGSYCKGENSELRPIRWRVLSVNGDDAFLLADKNIDFIPYNEKSTAVTWETCTLRKWLNNDFYNKAFDTEEKKAVIETAIVNKDNSKYRTEGGNDTKDRVYLLSKDEACNAEYGFDAEFNKNSRARKSENTDYANTKGVDSIWWLRSPGHDSSNAANVHYDGYGSNYGGNVNSCRYGVRPALHINLSSSSWRKVGKIRISV